MLRSAIIGGGINSAVGRAHFSAINLDRRADIKFGFFSRDPKVNKETGKNFSIAPPHIKNSAAELLEASDEFDVLHILTPPSNHFEIILDALKRGIPVVSEKPLVASLSEAHQIKEALDDRGGFLRVIFNYLGYPMVRQMRKIIQEGKIGRVHEIRCEMPQEGFVKLSEDGKKVEPQAWRLVDGEIPTVSLDLGVHVLMLMRFLTDEEPKTVVGIESTNGNFPQIIDSINALLSYQGGMVANIWYGKSYLGYRNGLSVSVFGSHGSLRWSQAFPEEVHATDSAGTRTVLDRASFLQEYPEERRYERFKVGHPVGFIEALANYYDCVFNDLESYLSKNENREQSSYGVNEAIAGLRILKAISVSTRSGLHPVEVLQIGR